MDIPDIPFKERLRKDAQIKHQSKKTVDSTKKLGNVWFIQSEME